jgi:acyl-CoA thioesterase
MNNLEESAQERLDRNAFMHYTHMEMESIEPDRAVFRVEIRPECRNPFGEVHGGAVYTLADNAAGGAAHTDGRFYVTQTSTMHFISNQREGTLRAIGTVRHRGRSTCLVEVEILGDQEKLIATGEFTFFCVSKNLAEERK